MAKQSQIAAQFNDGKKKIQTVLTVELFYQKVLN